MNITNTSTASSYYWNFCVADIVNNPPTGVNLGNPGSTLTMPVFSDFVESNGQFYVFVVNHINPSGIVRLSFGNSLLNTPTATNLGNFGNTLRNRLEGVQIVNEGGQWYGFVVGGDPDPLYNDVPQIVRLDFGTDLASTPTATDLGNIGNMYQPLDFYMFKENGTWHGFTVNKNGSITRFSFINGIANAPLAQNYNLGLPYPTGVNVINDNGNWYALVTTATDPNNGIARLEFGNSLLNNPTVIGLGNPGGFLSGPRDIQVVRFCDALVGFAINQPGGSFGSQIVRLDFHNNLQAVPDGTLLGNIGNLSFPHSISKLFRVNDKVYSFITNVTNNTITRLEFPSCNNASQSSFTGQNPPSITYNAPGVYNINLTTDDGLPSQSSYCKQVVVVPEPVHTPLQTIVLPPGGSVKIGTSNPSASYQWFPSGPYSDSITVNSEGLYIVETSGYGCSNRDSFRVVRQTDNSVHFTTPDTVCVSQPVNITDVSTASTYYWNFCVSNINETVPTAVNLGNIGNQFARPAFMDYAFYNGNYYGFVLNDNPSSLVRLDFGNSLLNTPTAVQLGNFGNIIQPVWWGEGIQILQSQGNWYAILVGGYTPAGSTPSMVKIEFGPNLANPNPVATDWGNIGGAMNQPIDLHIFQEGTNWYGLSTNAESNSITRFNFGSNFANLPTVDNLGNVGGLLAYPTGVYAINNNNDWKVFVVNGGDRTRSSGTYSLIRLDFGSSLLNTPTAVNLGNPGNLLQHPRDITLLKSCGQIIGFAVNGHFNNSNITKFDFSNDLTIPPSASNLGNVGNLSFPHSISKLFREGDNLYAFITNVDNSTITRLQFSGCTNSSIPSSTSPTPPPITYNAPGIYNINLTTDDGLPTQASFCHQVVVVPEPVHTPIKTILIRPGESVKIGTANVSGNYQWNTTPNNTDSITVDQEGLYFVKTSGYGCSNTDSFRIVFTTADFSYQQDPCDPLKVTFKNETPGATVVDWDFGNGLNAPGNANPTTSYPGFNNYNVTLTVTNAGGNTESVTKSIAVTIQTDSLIITNDTTICSGASIQLNAIGALNYCWTPVESLSAANIANPVATPVVPTTYYLNSLVTGTNIITNGNFSSGNTGFTSQYNYASVNVTEGQYFIGAGSKTWNGSFVSNCIDHSGAGNMMMVNGNPVADAKVWTQTVTVTPNTNYAFSTWVQSLFNDNPAQLMFSINGVTVGNTITASVPICNWTQFYTTWNSGTNTTAVISIVNKNTIVWGNDFALDDISFAPVFIKRDSVRINIEKPVIVARQDTTLCEGSSVRMDVTGDASSYLWSPAQGLSGTSGANPIASPATTTAYIVTGKTLRGCEAKDTVNVLVNPAPDVSSIKDTILCGPGNIQLSTSGNAASYTWSPADGLSDPSVASPIASPLTSVQYILTSTSGNGCTAADTVNVTVNDALILQVSNDTLICEGSPAQMQSTGNADHYSWSPSTGLTNPSIADPVARPLITTQYILTAGTNDGCTGKDTVTITVNPAPAVTITDDAVICPNSSVQLAATGGVLYQWRPSPTLDVYDVPNPVASPSTATTYVVQVTDGNNCTAKDSVTIDVRNYPIFMASADTTICEGTSTKLFASGGDQYQWSPAEGLDDRLSPSPAVRPLSSTLYSVYISEAICNIDTTIDIRVDVSPTPQIDARKSNDINCIDRTAQLTATGAASYTWNPAIHLDYPSRSNPLASLDTTTLFTVSGSNGYGCVGTDTITVKVTAEGSPLFVLPNVFTPNNDGVNDCFGLIKWGLIKLDEFSIYNRWGEKVFSTNNANACWDGNYKGIQQPSGTFVYVVRAKTFCGAINRKGTITIIR